MIDPIGEWRNDYRMAAILTAITNLFISVYGRKGAKLVTIEEFMPKWNGEEKETKRQDPEEMKKILMSLVANYQKEGK